MDIGEINAELVLIQHQDSLSPELLLGFGYDINHQKVLTPEEIINVRIRHLKRNFGSKIYFLF